MSMKLVGVSRLGASVRGLVAGTHLRVRQAIAQTTLIIRNRAVRNAPGPGKSIAKVKRPGEPTGMLRRSIIAELPVGAKLRGQVSVHAPYARYVEEGTSRTPRQPYLRPAVEGESDAHFARIARAMRPF